MLQHRHYARVLVLTAQDTDSAHYLRAGVGVGTAGQQAVDTYSQRRVNHHSVPDINAYVADTATPGVRSGTTEENQVSGLQATQDIAVIQ